MTELVKIGDVELTPIEFSGERVMTLSMMDAAHKRSDGTARRNFNEHRARLVEGEDFFVRNSYEARQIGITAPNGLILLTETGYSMLVKSFNDDLAWEVQRQLVRSYFSKRAEPAHGSKERDLVRKDSKSSNRNMNGMLEMTREDLGKTCASHHYSNEALMINEIVFGVRKAVDRDSLSATDLNRLIKMEMRNTLLIAKEKSYAERKELLKQYHEQLLLTPPPKTKLLREKRV